MGHPSQTQPCAYGHCRCWINGYCRGRMNGYCRGRMNGFDFDFDHCAHTLYNGQNCNASKTASK
ncbi:hypothetical protein DPMN_186117 [Dreissena polymorpha]|uniref:Uncharacterized protein n=1 Tax=Dreissena polymorpha TaxID=45954 RepID=A0A9D4DP41_DREPO|nr:hypothetical protein DPMN_186117 [Dreissena polymorpha]